MEPAELGFRGNPVTSNAQWTPQIKTVNGIAMVLVPAGCFMMGGEDYDNEQPVHEQCFDDCYWIARHPITNAQYAEAAKIGVCRASRVADNQWFNDPLQPVIGISWFDALAFAQWKGMELATEAQWEYAARGPDSLLYPWGNDYDLNNPLYKEISERWTAKVGSRPDGTTWVGTVDMGDNVGEWTRTIYQPYPYTPNDGRETIAAKDVRRVVRGEVGRFFKGRNARGPYFRNNSLGFRVVLSAVPD